MDVKKEEPPKPRRRVKKARGHGGHHGGAWKVAYADFVTAMMALFLVLWLVSQADTKLKQAIAAYFRSPGVFDTMQGGILSGNKKISKEPERLDSVENEQALIGVAEALQKQFETRPEFSRFKDQVKIEVTDEGLRIQLLDKADRVSFASGSAELGPEAQAVLAEIAQGICALPNKINIGGHTDSRVFPSNNGYTNWELSTDRANVARRTLEANCVKPEQIRRVIGFADTELLVPDDPYSPANRRISITVLRLTENPSDAKKDKEISVPDPKARSENKTSPVPDEVKLAKKKLETEGSVVVGEADKIPDKPKIK
ncbi:MAG TPA: flagellar motor protein MotB [Pyrinomonadaceae bacterium]|nr:OmpA family protein [Acidobacteriota bacterium]HQZ95561.1 flagellar motor protein MotB [Pyrinomonadaceae bacterium]